jgi:hypothetical protein
LSAAASGQMTPEAAMDGFKKAIDQMTGGKATINNTGFTKPSASNAPYVFDPSIQVRKGK